jgi:hypothetical protein
MTTTISTQVVFIDLAAFSELDAFLYGGELAVTWFVGTVQKSNWFSIVPIFLRHDTVPNFNVKTSATINRTGDYALNTWFNVTLPQIMLSNDPSIYTGATVRWTKNLGHNLIRNLTLTHNELVTQQFTSEWLDMNFQFSCPANKRIGYRSMIGDVAANYIPQTAGIAVGSTTPINVPLPLWYCEDSGRALPIAALPFCETKINYDLRDYTELVVVYPGLAGVSGTRIATVNDVYVYNTTNIPSYINPHTYTTYAMVHNDERALMGSGTRDILMHQIQMAQTSPLNNVSSHPIQSFDIRFSNPIVGLFFAVKNVSIATFSSTSGQEHSNYTTEPGYSGVDPIASAQLLYENNLRMNMTSDYYSLIAPYYHSKTIPDEVGYHLHPYALDVYSLNPCGSTNYNKLSNVSLQFNMSQQATNAASLVNPVDQNNVPLVWPNAAGVNVPFPQSSTSIIIGKNHQLGRIGNGVFGFPTL